MTDIGSAREGDEFADRLGGVVNSRYQSPYRELLLHSPLATTGTMLTRG